MHQMISDAEMDQFFDATTEDGNSAFSTVDNDSIAGASSADESMSGSSDNRGDPIGGPWFVDDDETMSQEETASASERDVPKMEPFLAAASDTMSDLRSQISVWYVHEQGSRTQPADIDPPTILVGHLVTGRDDMIVGDVLYRTPSDDLRFSFPQIQGRLWGREERASKLLSVEVIIWFPKPLNIPDDFDVPGTYDDLVAMSPTERSIWAHDALTARAREDLIEMAALLEALTI
ncbi:MAG: hypothetical protein L6R36_007506 [Xanthoria steineri]|nr:MAG: hypothetical protein L6R36_007506 [Xanthoria steineri]